MVHAAGTDGVGGAFERSSHELTNTCAALEGRCCWEADRGGFREVDGLLFERPMPMSQFLPIGGSFPPLRPRSSSPRRRPKKLEAGRPSGRQRMSSASSASFVELHDQAWLKGIPMP